MKRVGMIDRSARVCDTGMAAVRRALPLPLPVNRIGAALLIFLILLAGVSFAASGTGKDQELFNQGKILIFDRNWEGARGIFQRVIREFPQSGLVPQAYYFIARCYQFQGRESEAMRGYESFLQKYPNEPVLLAEARNAVVELAASLMEKGDASYRDRLVSSLSDPQKQVRYFAAIRCSQLKDKQIGSLSVPILRDIVSRETERDLVDRARIALLRLDPEALTREKAPPSKPNKSAAGANGRMFHLEVYEEGSKEPKVELTLPIALAEFAIKALDESTKKELKKQGFDVENTWQGFKQLGPMKILTIRDGGNLVKIWVD
jgi:hypothetical protein